MADSRHSLAVSADGRLFSWGSASSGRLGLSNVKNMQKDASGDPYQASPRLVEALAGVRVVQASAPVDVADAPHTEAGRCLFV